MIQSGREQRDGKEANLTKISGERRYTKTKIVLGENQLGAVRMHEEKSGL